MFSAGEVRTTLRELDNVLTFASESLYRAFGWKDDRVVTSMMVDRNNDGYWDGNFFTKQRPNILNYARTEIALFRAGLISHLRTDLCEEAVCYAPPDPVTVRELSELAVKYGSIGASTYLHLFNVDQLSASWRAGGWTAGGDDVRALEGLAQVGVEKSLSILIDQASTRADAVESLSRLAQQGNKKAAATLQTLNPDSFIAVLRDKGWHPEERRALETLRQFQNAAVIQALNDGHIQPYEPGPAPWPCCGGFAIVM